MVSNETFKFFLTFAGSVCWYQLKNRWSLSKYVTSIINPFHTTGRFQGVLKKTSGMKWIKKIIKTTTQYYSKKWNECSENFLEFISLQVHFGKTFMGGTTDFIKNGIHHWCFSENFSKFSEPHFFWTSLNSFFLNTSSSKASSGSTSPISRTLIITFLLLAFCWKSSAKY